MVLRASPTSKTYAPKWYVVAIRRRRSRKFLVATGCACSAKPGTLEFSIKAAASHQTSGRSPDCTPFEKDGRALKVHVEGQLVFNGTFQMLNAALGACPGNVRKGRFLKFYCPISGHEDVILRKRVL